MRRVLILSANVGSGHGVAAKALETAFSTYPDVEVRTVDVLDMTNEAYASLYSDTYQVLAKRMPWLLGLVYDINDEPSSYNQPLRKLWDMLNTQPVVRFVRDYQPDICVCTHFLPAGIIAQLMTEDNFDTSLSVVTTDYDFQGLWLSPTFTRYFVARGEGRARLIDLGVHNDRITVSGIPVDVRFGEPVDRAAVLEQYELRDDLPTVVVSAGAVGGGPAEQIVTRLMRMEQAFQCIVVCGRNEQLLSSVEALTQPRAAMFRVLGYTNDMLNIIRIATLFIGKPGGLTASECMAAGTPMIIVTPIPGQEERNADYLLEEGAAVRSNDLDTIDYKLGQLLDDPARVARLRLQAQQVGRPDAANVIAATTLADQSSPTSYDWRSQQSDIGKRFQLRTTLPSFPWSSASDVHNLDDDERGIFLHQITAAELRLLRSVLKPSEARTRTFTLNAARVEHVHQLGVGSALCQRLADHIARHGPSRLRYTSTTSDPGADVAED
jgi:processive 1,2-diacylglycerol beta-glucosyltransferase